MNRIFYYFETFLKNQISKRKFFKILLGSLVVFIAQNQFLKIAFAKKNQSPPRKAKGIKGAHDIVLAQGDDPYQNTINVVKAMGGMERFVKNGEVVVVKPNMAWDRTPQQASNTNPLVVAALVEMCYKAGAKRVNVFDIPCNDEKRSYENSGIQEAAVRKGAQVYYADKWNVVKAKFPYDSPMEGWEILRDAIVCDVFINVPVLKHHGLTGLTLSMKNLMGVCAGIRGLMHVNIGRKLVDLTDFVSPDLTVIDATRVLTKHGPSGGNLEDVVTMNQVFAATDPTLADCYACHLMKKDPRDVPYIKAAIERGFGSTNIDKADILKV